MKRTAWIWVLPLTLLGCGGEEARASTGEVGQAPEVPTELDEGADDAEAGPFIRDPSFELRATANGPYTVGTEGTFTILLTPRGEYHVNEDFPMRVALAGPDEVTWPSRELGDDDTDVRTLERASFQVRFTAGAAGEHRVTAEVDFAVCTPETCIPERRTLALLLPVE